MNPINECDTMVGFTAERVCPETLQHQHSEVIRTILGMSHHVCHRPQIVIKYVLTCMNHPRTTTILGYPIYLTYVILCHPISSYIILYHPQGVEMELQLQRYNAELGAVEQCATASW